MNTKPQTNKPSGAQQPDIRSKSKSLSKQGLTNGANDRPSARPAFPTVANAVGIKHDRPPKIVKIKGLVRAWHPAYAMIHVEGSAEYNKDALRLRRIQYSGVN